MIPYIMNYSVTWTLFFVPVISNGNRTECSPIPFVMIRVINKIGQPHRGSLISLIASMITDRIGWHEVLLAINHNYNKIWNTRNSESFFSMAVKKRAFQVRACDGVYCPITKAWHVLFFYTVLVYLLKSGQLIANQIWEFCYSYD